MEQQLEAVPIDGNWYVHWREHLEVKFKLYDEIANLNQANKKLEKELNDMRDLVVKYKADWGVAISKYSGSVDKAINLSEELKDVKVLAETYKTNWNDAVKKIDSLEQELKDVSNRLKEHQEYNKRVKMSDDEWISKQYSNIQEKQKIIEDQRKAIDDFRLKLARYESFISTVATCDDLLSQLKEEIKNDNNRLS